MTSRAEQLNARLDTLHDQATGKRESWVRTRRRHTIAVVFWCVLGLIAIISVSINVQNTGPWLGTTIGTLAAIVCGYRFRTAATSLREAVQVLALVDDLTGAVDTARDFIKDIYPDRDDSGYPVPNHPDH